MNCIIYARKSTESEDRQVLSIEAQINELKAVALNQGLNILDVLFEAKSAKAPGRPTFKKLIEMIYKVKDFGILCWKLDRLARNPVDGGQLIWSLEQGKIKEIITPHRRFTNNGDDKFWMQLEFGIAKKYIDDLSDNVKRGNRAKLEKGILPGKAPLGYLNDKAEKTIIKDPERFYLVRKIWDKILTGDYQLNDLLKTAEEKWGLTTTPFKVIGGKPLTKSLLYRILSNPFYYGAILRNGEMYPGSHEPMITQEEFERVQTILGRPSRKARLKQFAFTGMIQCGECNSAITAEDKINRHGSHYVYYHCTRKKGEISNTCKQRYIRVESLEEQVMNYLEKIYLPQKVVDWTLNQLKESREAEDKLWLDARESLKKALRNCENKLDRLLQMKLKELLTDEEYLAQKSLLVKKKMKFERNIEESKENPKTWFEPSERLFIFLTLAKDCFKDGDDQLKRQILDTISSNLFLKDKTLLIEAKKPFRLIAENGKSLPGQGLLDQVRTFFADPSRHFHIPVLKK